MPHTALMIPGAGELEQIDRDTMFIGAAVTAAALVGAGVEVGRRPGRRS